MLQIELFKQFIVAKFLLFQKKGVTDKLQKRGAEKAPKGEFADGIQE